MIDEASRRALKTRERITMTIFTDVISENMPSVSITEIRRYEKLKKHWENERHGFEEKSERPPMGF